MIQSSDSTVVITAQQLKKTNQIFNEHQMLKYQVVKQNEIIEDYKKKEEISQQIDNERIEQLKLCTDELVERQNKIDKLKKQVNARNWTITSIGMVAVIATTLALLIR